MTASMDAHGLKKKTTLFERARRHPVGFREVMPAETNDALATERLRIVDVREPFEFAGELGHVAGAELVPLATFEAHARAWPRDEPVVLICRSGGRSARAAVALTNMGFSKVMNLVGGMIGWNDARLPVERA